MDQLDANCRLRLRLVCQKLKDDIDGGAGLIVKLSEPPCSEFLEFLSDVSIRQFYIDEDVKFKSIEHDLFLDPLNLHSFQCDGKTNAKLVREIIYNCSNITRLEIYSNIEGNLVSESKHRVRLPYLTSFTILPSMCLIGETYMATNGCAVLENPFNIISQIYAPTLNQVYFKAWVNEKTKVTTDYASETILDFLSLHAKSLKNLRITLKPMNSFTTDMTTGSLDEIPNENVCRRMEQVGLRLDGKLDTLCMDYECRESPWNSLINKQSTLTKFQYTNGLLRWQDLVPVITRCGALLKSLELTLAFCTPLDFRLISKNCVNLQELKLLKGKQLSCTRLPERLQPVNDIIHVEEFPKSITNLVLTFIRGTKTTWQKLTTMRNLKRIIIVVEKFCEGSHAVPLDVVLKLMHIRSLRVCLITRLHCESEEEFATARLVCHRLMTPNAQYYCDDRVNLGLCIS